MAAREEEIAIGGRRYAGLAMGDAGPQVVLLHGFGSDRMSWYLNQPDIATYARTFALDLPGHGRSDVDVGAARPEDIARIVADVLDETERRRVHIVAHSFGGAVAFFLAHARPDLVASLSLVAPAGLGGRVNTDFLSAFVTMATPEDALTALSGLVSKPRLISRQMAARVLGEVERPGGREALASIAAALGDVAPRLDPVIADLGRSGLPRQVFWGGDDQISPFDAERVARLRADLTIIPGTGHVPHMENAARVNAGIRKLIA